ncbi:hypothetical protein HYU50_01095 [Candidatus Woesearchaeota archaeon]|nr:hypothetical protein [Candidatus Woesearchaeota archaeon]
MHKKACKSHKLVNSHKLLRNLTSRNLKSQAALEFLTTYIWAFVVILVAIGALYYFGLFDFSKFLPQRCLFPSQFECIDYSFVGDQVRLRLANNIGEDVSVRSFSITNDASYPLSCSGPPAVPFDWAADTDMDFVFLGCQNGTFIIGERTDAKITMNYCSTQTANCPEHTINGKITAVVNRP